MSGSVDGVPSSLDSWWRAQALQGARPLAAPVAAPGGAAGAAGVSGAVGPAAKAGVSAAGGPAAASGAPESEFASTLQAALEPLRFSQHAQQRLQVAGRTLSPADLQRLSDAAQKLAKRGGREALLLMPDLALLLHVRSRTVITALTGDRVRDGVFTNIDSAVVL